MFNANKTNLMSLGILEGGETLAECLGVAPIAATGSEEELCLDGNNEILTPGVGNTVATLGPRFVVLFCCIRAC